VTGEVARAAVAYAHNCSVAGRYFFLRVSAFRYGSSEFVPDAPMEAPYSVAELYVNCHLPTRYNQYREAAYHVILPDIYRATSEYSCSQKGEMC
jgi:hypothetical protein